MKLKDCFVGRRVSCCIEGTAIEDAKLTKEGTYFYICQDEKDGRDAYDKLGYKHSWVVERGTARDLENNGVTDLKLISTGKITEGSIQIGDIIFAPTAKFSETTKCEVVGVCGKVIFYYLRGMVCMDTESQLIEDGYTFDEEITLAEVCRELGRDVKIIK